MGTVHTATPWKNHGPNDKGRCLIADTGDSGICEVFIGVNERGEANAAFIVRACNAHDDLVKALQRAERVLNHVGGAPSGEILGAWEEARAALAKAEQS